MIDARYRTREGDMHGDTISTAALNRPPRPRGQGRSGWTSVATLGVGTFAIGTGVFVVAGVLSQLADDFEISAGAAGLTVTVFALAYATGAALLGALFGTRSPRRVLIASLVLFGLCNALSAAAPTLPALLATRILAALSASVYVPAAGAAAVAAVALSYRGRALAVILGGTSIAVVLGAPIGVALTSMLSWRAAFGLVAALASVTVLGLLLSGVGSGPRNSPVPDRAGEPSGRHSGERWRPMRSPAVLVTLGVTLLMMAASNSMYTYLAVLLGASAGPVGVGMLIGAFGVGGAVGAWWGGAAADRWGDGRVGLLAAAVLVAGFALLPPALTTTAGALAVVIGWGIAAWGFVLAQQHRLIGLGAGPTPVLLALNSSAIHFGFAAGALLGGVVVDFVGAGSLWLFAVACGGTGLLVHLISVGRLGHDQVSG
jgi:predicted MFS family arabinose efflux permease